MAFPQLNTEDFGRINSAMKDMLGRSEATAVLFVERAGYLIAQCGNTDSFDATTVATLAGNAFAATQFMVDLLQETNFSSMYQQGEQRSVLWLKIDDECLLVIIFLPKQSVGMIKFYALHAAKIMAEQLRVATVRAPEALFDIATENPTDIGDLFKSKAAEPEEPAPEEPAPQ